MKSPIADPNVSLMDLAGEKRRRSRIMEDCRRYTAQTSDPNAPVKSPWKITVAPTGPAWEFQRDNAGKVIFAKQLRAIPETMDTDPKWIGVRFKCVLEGQYPCCVGGQHLEPGAQLDCLADAAFSIHGIRGRILEQSAK